MMRGLIAIDIAIAIFTLICICVRLNKVTTVTV